MSAEHRPSSGGARTGIVVLNWRNAADTIECLDSLLALRDARWVVYVVDNASGDGSLERITAWCRSALPARRVREATAASATTRMSAPGAAEDGDIVILANDVNGGFSAGNNVGARLALAHDCDYVWFLNNDTVVEPDCLRELEATASRHAPIGVVGACILEYHVADTVQCLGGVRFNWALTSKRSLYAGLPASEVQRVCDERLPYDYVMGASLFVPRETLQRVGLLSEEYFLYHEELDYAERCRAHGLAMRTACGARLRHKYGASAGSSTDIARKSATSAFYGSRSAVLCTRKYRPGLVPIVLLARLAKAAMVVMQGRPGLFLPTLRGTWAGLRAPRLASDRVAIASDA